MSVNNRLSKLSFFLYVFIYDYVWIRIILFPYFYETFHSMAFFYSLLLTLIVRFFVLLLPKKILNHDYENRYMKSKFKHFYNIVLAVESIIGMAYCAYVLSSVFVRRCNPVVLIVPFSVVMAVISFLKPSDIVQIATWFIIGCIGFIVISFIYTVPMDYSLLFPLKSYSWYFIPIYALLLLSDNLTLLLMDKKNFRLSKPTFLFSILISLFFFNFELLFTLTTTGDTLLEGLPWLGFLSLSIKPVTKYVGNFDFAYIILILVCCIFKYAFNWSVIRNAFKQKSKKLTWIIAVCLSISSSVVAALWIKSDFLIDFVLIVFGVGILILGWMLKEVYHASASKK